MAMSKITPIFILGDHTSVMNGDDEKYITATNMTINPTDCDEPCNSVVTITWKNIGQKKEKFRPAIKVNGKKIELGIEITLKKNQITEKTFSLTNLMEGTYTICPYPN